MCEIALLSLISDLYFPISALLSSHLRSLALWSSRRVEKDDEYPAFQSTCAGGPYCEAGSDDTHARASAHTTTMN